MSEKVRIIGLEKHFGDLVVLDGIDVNLHRVVRGKVQVSLDNECEDRKCSREQQQLDKDPADIFEHSDAVVGLA